MFRDTKKCTPLWGVHFFYVTENVSVGDKKEEKIWKQQIYQIYSVPAVSGF